MRSPLSWLHGVVDWQAANVVLGAGVGPVVAKGARAGSAAIGKYGFADEIHELASSSILPACLALFEKYPDAVRITMQQYFHWVGETEAQQWRSAKYGMATLTTSNERTSEVFSVDWPLAVEDEDWDHISKEDSTIHFTLARDEIEAFTVNGVTARTPLAEIVLQEHKIDLEPQFAAEFVRSSFGEARVAQGKAPQRWGIPGLKLLADYLEAGGNPSAMDACGMTPIAIALHFGQVAWVEQLVQAGVDINAPAAGGLYPIDVAVLSGNMEMVRLCVELGASPNTNGYMQPIMRAIDMHSPEIFGALVEAGARMDAETADGLSVMAYVEDTSEHLRAQYLSVLTAKQIEGAMDVGAPDGVVIQRKKTLSL